MTVGIFRTLLQSMCLEDNADALAAIEEVIHRFPGEDVEAIEAEEHVDFGISEYLIRWRRVLKQERKMLLTDVDPSHLTSSLYYLPDMLCTVLQTTSSIDIKERVSSCTTLISHLLEREDEHWPKDLLDGLTETNQDYVAEHLQTEYHKLTQQELQEDVDAAEAEENEETIEAEESVDFADLKSMSSDQVDVQKLPEQRDCKERLKEHHFKEMHQTPKEDPAEYQMQSRPHGLAYIINNKHFRTMKARQGADMDTRNLEHVFQQLGFNVDTYENLIAGKMQCALQELAQLDHSTFDCLIIAILSHGIDGAIYGTDEHLVKVHDIMRYFDGQNCPTMAGKPKIFLLQACREEEFDSRVEATDSADATVSNEDHEENESLNKPDGEAPVNSSTDNIVEEEAQIFPLVFDANSSGNSNVEVNSEEEAQRHKTLEFEGIKRDLSTQSDILLESNMLLACATVPVSSERGSVFVQAVSETLLEYSRKEDLLSMMTMVNNKVTTAFGSSTGRYTHVPAVDVINMLTAKLFFFQELKNTDDLKSMSSDQVDVQKLPEQRGCKEKLKELHFKEMHQTPKEDPAEHILFTRVKSLWLQEYQMQSQPRGVAYIINNKYFRTMKTRHESDVDKRNFEHVFQQFGFMIDSHDNLRAGQMQKAMREFSQLNHSTFDCLIIAILSHGIDGAFYGTDEQLVKVHDIMRYFDGQNCPTMAGKPKIFLLQACREEQFDSRAEPTDSADATVSNTDHEENESLNKPDGEAPVNSSMDNIEEVNLEEAQKLEFEANSSGDNNVGVNAEEEVQRHKTLEFELSTQMSDILLESDMLLAYATVPVNSERGSLFAQALCETFLEHARKEDLLSMMTMINNKVAKAFGPSTGRYKQIPAIDVVNMLRKKLYFIPELKNTDDLRSMSSDQVEGQNLPEQMGCKERLKEHHSKEMLHTLKEHPAEVYQMQSRPRGLAYIINNKHFRTMSTRIGTDVDKRNLEHTFQQIGFNVDTHENLRAGQMQKAWQELAQWDHSTFDCFIIAILSHGIDGAIYGTDEQLVKVHDIMQYFNGQNCPTMAGKPKIFILQACREEVNSEEEAQKLPTLDLEGITGKLSTQSDILLESDVLLAYATVPVSLERGSLFVQAVSETLLEYSRKEDLLSMMTMVNNKVVKAFGSSTGRYKQIPGVDVVNMLRKKLFFFPGYYA